MDLQAHVAAARPDAEDSVLARALEIAAARLGAAPPKTLGRYRRERVLGEGGFGTVWRAHDPWLRRTVAIKLLHRGLAVAAREALRHEAQALAALSHPNVVRVFDLGVEDGVEFLVMECIDGCDLATWLATPRTPSQVLGALADAATGLAAAHRLGIVHRDVKPANILVDHRGRACVSDFGIARAAALPHTAPDHADGITRVSAVVGTPRYMAPEQHEGRSDAHAVDVFALGATAYEAITGVVAFAGRTPATLLEMKIAGEITPAPRGRAPSVAVHEMLLAALDPDPGRRPTASALAAALRPRATRSRGWTVVAVGCGIAAALALLPAADADPCASRASSGAPSIDGVPQATIDARAAALDEASRDACLAHAQGAMSRRSLAATLDCVEARRGELAGLAEGLAAGKATAADAVTTLAALPDASTCLAAPERDATTSAPQSAAPLARALAANAVGDGPTARAEATTVLAIADAQGNEGLQARALLERGIAGAEMVDDDVASEDLERAFWLATAEDDPRTAAGAAIHLMRLVGRRRGDITTAEAWAGHARAALARIGDDVHLRVWYETNHALVLAECGDAAAGLAASDRALAWLGDGALDEIGAYEPLLVRAMVLRQAGRSEAAFASALAAQRIARRVAGEDSVMDLRARATMAATWADRGSGDRALAEMRLVVASLEGLLGDQDERVHQQRANLARLLLMSGQYVAARDQLRTEYDHLRARAHPSNPRLASLAQSIAVAHAELGERQVAKTWFHEALAIYEAGPPHREAAASWMALAGIARAEGDRTRALAMLERAVGIGEATGAIDHPKILHARGLLALLQMEVSGSAEGIAAYEALRAHAIALGHRPLAAELDGYAAMTFASMGMPARGVPFAEDALAFIEPTGTAREVAYARRVLSEVLDAAGHSPERMLDERRKACAIFRAPATFDPVYAAACDAMHVPA